MNQLQKLITFLTLFVTVSSTSQNFKSGVEYLEFISSELTVITKNNWKYTKAIAHSKSDRNIRSKRNVLIKSIERALQKVKRAKAYDGDEYKKEVIKFLNLNENLLNQDYEKVIDMKEVAEQSYDLMEAYILAQEMADKKMAEAQKEYETHFYNYAEKHNINIVENDSDLGKKMDIANEVFEHYNKMHLIFFKVRINEIYLLDAIEQGDVSAIQQNKNALIETANEGLDILKDLDLYKNDDSLIEATKQCFEFFIDEATNGIPQITDFLILNSDFEKIKATLDKTPQRKRTQEIIDTYNKKVEEINKSADRYNKVNKQLFDKRQKVYDFLNETNAKFLSKHIPKD